MEDSPLSLLLLPHPLRRQMLLLPWVLFVSLLIRQIHVLHTVYVLPSHTQIRIWSKSSINTHILFFVFTDWFDFACVICNKNLRDVVCGPCGDMNMCVQCLEREYNFGADDTLCPLCKNPLTSLTELFHGPLS